MNTRQEFVKIPDKNLSKRCKARLLNVNLSSCYVQCKTISYDTITLMNEIRDIYAIRPFQGYRRMTLGLKDKGYKVNRKRVARLMQIMCLQAIRPKMNLSKRNHEHKVYPYLLKQYPPLKPHDVWCVDSRTLKPL